MKLRNQSCQLILGHYTQVASNVCTIVSVDLFHHERKGVRSR